MDLGAMSAALASLKAISDIGKGLLATRDVVHVQNIAVDLNAKVLDAQQRIMEGYAAQAELTAKIEQLEKQVASLKDWEARKKKYRLAAPFPSCMVYALLKSESAGEPAHYLCTACFERGEASILQGREGRHEKGVSRYSVYLCQKTSCRAQAETQYFNVEAPKFAEDILGEHQHV